EQRSPVEATQRAHMAKVQVRRNYGDRKVRQGTHDRHDVSEARSRIEQDCALGAEDQVTVIALIITRLSDRKGRRVDRLDHEVVAEPSASPRRGWLWQRRPRVPACV